MKFIEIERKCEEINALREQLEAKKTECQKLESDVKKRTEEIEILREIAELRGEAYEDKYESEELMKARKDVEDYQERIKRLEQEILEGLKSIAFESIPMIPPNVDSERRSTINFEGNTYDCAVKFIASILSSDVPLKLGNVELHPGKIIVTNIEKRDEVIEALKVFRSDIGRIARIALQEEDPDVQEIVNHFYESTYREIWEAIEGRRRITNQDLYSDLGLETSEEKKKVRNFFTTLEIALKDKRLFIRVSPGIYDLTFLGSLVWKRYYDKYLREREIIKESPREVLVEGPIGKEEKREMATLNKYLGNNEVKEVIYGKEVS